MTALAFDTLGYARRLEDAGFTRQQSEALAIEQAKLIDERLATKADIEAARLATKTDIEAAQRATKADIEVVRLATKADIEVVRLATNAVVREAELRLEAKIESVKADVASVKSDILKWTVGTIGLQTVVILGAVLALTRIAQHP